MRAALGALAILVAACSPAAENAGTSHPPASSGPATVTTSSPSTTISLPVQIQDCSTPQIWFSALCESYLLAQRWHVDRPLDPRALAEAALAGLRAFQTDETETPPRTLICDIPDVSFVPMCEELADRAQRSGLPIGEAVEAAVVSMTGTGLDQFSYYLPPELAGGFRSNGIVGGIGVLLDATDAAGSRCVRIADSCPLQIVFVLEDNPGAEAGLMPGDEIVSIDGLATDGQPFVETAIRLAGDETGSVDISVTREGAPLEFTIERSPLVVPTVEIDMPRPGVGYLLIPDFEPDVPDLVADALAELFAREIDRLVIDLRDNPGGHLDAAIQVASHFLPGGPVVRTIGPGEDFTFEAGLGGLATRTELAVLVNHGSASAAEILAAALRDRRGARLIGAPTFGKDAVQIAFEMNNGGEFTVAVARWLSPDGATVAGGGLIPDHTMALPRSMTTSQLADIAFGET